MLATPNVALHVVESVYGDRLPECAPAPGENYGYHAVRVTSEIWLKENLINIGVKNLLPKDWRYLAWVDCDIHFRDSGWALSTIHQLQHYNILQPWQSAADLDFHGNIMNAWTSFGSLCASGKPMSHKKGEHGYCYAHTGYAWACTRYFYENIEKLVDFNIVGSGDHLIAWACLGQVDSTMPRKISPGYKSSCDRFEQKASFASASLVGFVPGRIEHNFHGSKVNRQYWDRWQILTKNNFNPLTDLSYDSQGVLVLSGSNKYKLEREIMVYNRNRLEDDLHN